MGGLFKLSEYTVTESDLHQDEVSNTVFLPDSSTKMIIVHLVHTYLGSKDMPPQNHHQKHCIVLYQNINLTDNSYFYVTCIIFTPNPNNMVTYRYSYLFLQAVYK